MVHFEVESTKSRSKTAACSLITIPETELFYEDWTGFAWIKENPATFESGWMLSGEIAGGMTAWGLDRWPDQYYDPLVNQSVDSTDNPLNAVEIKVIKGSDFLAGIAGQQLPTKKGTDLFFNCYLAVN